MKKILFLKNTNAFTLLETIVMVIVMGILGSIAIPQFPTMIENQRAASARTALRSIHMSQRRYFVDHHNVYASNSADLDVDTAAPNGFTRNVSNDPSQLATMTRTGFDYILAINANGTISCTGSYYPTINH